MPTKFESFTTATTVAGMSNFVGWSGATLNTTITSANLLTSLGNSLTHLNTIAYPSSVGTLGNLLSSDGTSFISTNDISINSLKVANLTASQAVVTDGSKNLVSMAYATTATASTIAQRDGSGNLTAGTFNGALNGNAATATFATTATTATNATNSTNAADIAITDDTTTNSTMYPLWVTTTTGNLPAKVSSSKLTFNPNTATLTTTTFSGVLSGNATTATSATTATNSTNAVNVGITDDTSTNATMYPTWVTATTGNLPQKTSSTKITFNPSTATLTTTTFSGALSGNASTATSATSATNSTNIGITDDTTTNATMYPLWVTTTTGNLPAKVSSSKITFNPSTATLQTTTFTGALSGNASTATALQTTRAIYGNNFDGTAALTQVISSTYGGTGNGFTKFTGATTSEKTYTLPNATCTVLTDNAAVTVAQGGTGQTSYTNGQLLIGNTSGNTLAKATLTGTSNQITVTNGGGTITLSTPQDIATGSSPTFTGLTISGTATTSIFHVRPAADSNSIVNVTRADGVSNVMNINSSSGSTSFTSFQGGVDIISGLQTVNDGTTPANNNAIFSLYTTRNSRTGSLTVVDATNVFSTNIGITPAVTDTLVCGNSSFRFQGYFTRLISQQTGTATATGQINFGDNAGNNNLYSGANNIIFANSAGTTLWSTSVSNGQINSHNVIPLTTNTYNFGSSSLRIATIFLVNNPDVSSDIRLKTNIEDNPLSLKFIDLLRPVRYMLIEEGRENVEEIPRKPGETEDTNPEYSYDPIPGKIWNYGLIAQEVEKALESQGIDVETTGFIKKDDTPDKFMGLKYEQFSCILISAVKELLKRIEVLENDN